MSNPMFDACSAAEAGALSGETRRHNPLKQATEMQARLHAVALDPETEPGKAAQCACAWERLEARKAVLRGLPANTSQSIKSEPKQRKARVSGPVEPIEVIEPVPVKPTVKPTIKAPGTIESASLPVSPLLSQPDAPPAKSTGAWAKAMGEPFEVVQPNPSKH